MKPMADTAIDIMKKAHFAEERLWTIGGTAASFEIRRMDGDEWKLIEAHRDLETAMERRTFLAFDAGYRAGLRALAEMEPTDKMVFEHGKAMGKSKNEYLVGRIFDGFKAALLIAANEGEKDGPCPS